MLAILTALLPAHAQSRGPTDAWLAYQDVLDELDLLAPLEDPEVRQLDWGGISVVFDAETGTEVGKVYTTLTGFEFTERWFWSINPALDPGASFGFRFACNPCFPMDPVIAFGPAWETNPYYHQKMTYVGGLPPSAITDALKLVNYEIDRYTFEIMIDGNLTGHLLREVHHPVGQYFFVDHWVFEEDYVMPSSGSPDVVVVAAAPFVNTAEFFQNLQGTDVYGYTKIKYYPLVGGDTDLYP